MAAEEEPLPNANKALLTTELGETGLKGARPYDGHVFEEFLPQLRGWAGARKFREMADNDPVVGAFLYALEMLCRGVKWQLVPPEDSGDEGQKLKEWYGAVLLKEMETPFVEVVAEALSMLPHGYALLEIVLQRRTGEGGGIGVKKLAPRSQETVYRWFFTAAGDVRGFEQWRVSGPNATIPIEKCLHFKTTSRRGNPEGKSALRNAYITYERKNSNEVAEGRRINRNAGIVDMRVPGKYLDPNADANDKVLRSAYQSLVDKLAKDGTGGVLLPSDRDDKGNLLVELSYLALDSSKTADVGTTIDRQNKLIAMTVLADFILLGHEGVGSYSLGATKSTLFDRATQAFLDKIALPFNQHLIPLLADLNGHDPKLVPELKPGALSAPDLAVLGDFITKVTGAGMPLFPSENGAVEEALLDAAELPKVGLDPKAQQVKDKEMETALHAPLPGEPGSEEAHRAAQTQVTLKPPPRPMAAAVKKLLQLLRDG